MQTAILASLRNGATITDACRAAGVRVETAWKWRNTNDEFRDEFNTAREDGKDAVEIQIAEMRADLRLKAIRSLGQALDGENIQRSQLTAAIFVAKSELGMVETSRVESVEVVPIIDDVPDE